MKVYVAFITHGEEIVGVFSTRKRAIDAAESQCDYPHEHIDQNRCGATAYPLDELIPVAGHGTFFVKPWDNVKRNQD